MNSNDKNRNLDQDPPSRAVDLDRNKNSKDTDSKTFNEDESSYEKRNDSKNMLNNGTPNNNWNANEPLERSYKDSYDDNEEERLSADYINSDHSDYNRTNSRFYWNDYDI